MTSDYGPTISSVDSVALPTTTGHPVSGTISAQQLSGPHQQEGCPDRSAVGRHYPARCPHRFLILQFFFKFKFR